MKVINNNNKITFTESKSISLGKSIFYLSFILLSITGFLLLKESNREISDLFLLLLPFIFLYPLIINIKNFFNGLSIVFNFNTDELILNNKKIDNFENILDLKIIEINDFEQATRYSLILERKKGHDIELMSDFDLLKINPIATKLAHELHKELKYR